MIAAAGGIAAMRLDERTGWLEGVRWVPSPNRDPRPDGCDVDLVVVHGISLPPGVYGGGHIDALFTNRLDPRAHPYFEAIAGLTVSAHVLIDRVGQVTQYVSFFERAWHAGPSRFCGRERCNDFSVGIELEGTDDAPYEEVQYRRLAAVIALLRRRWPVLDASRVVGHSDVAPGRKTDPGLAFDWPRLRALTGLG